MPRLVQLPGSLLGPSEASQLAQVPLHRDWQRSWARLWDRALPAAERSWCPSLPARAELPKQSHFSRVCSYTGKRLHSGKPYLLNFPSMRSWLTFQVTTNVFSSDLTFLNPEN